MPKTKKKRAHILDLKFVKTHPPISFFYIYINMHVYKHMHGTHAIYTECKYGGAAMQELYISRCVILLFVVCGIQMVRFC